MSYETFVHSERFSLEGGSWLPSLEIAYQTFGTLNAEKNNVIWVCHALTANSDVCDWWKGLFGEGDFFDPEQYFIVCANNLGSCYGSTGPLSEHPDWKTCWYGYFPSITIRDMARAHDLLRQYLDLDVIHLLIGGSQGGQIAMEWAITQPELHEHLVLIATNARHSAWGIAFNESQRLAIKADRTYFSNSPDGGQKGLQAARSMALLSYRNYDIYVGSQREEDEEKLNDYRAASYQRYQGEKLVQRFNAYSYVTLSLAMDSHNVGRGRGTAEQALAGIRAKALVMGLSSDLLFPLEEQRFLARHIPGAKLARLESYYGHDGFLIETQQISQQLSAFLPGTFRLQNQVVSSTDS